MRGWTRLIAISWVFMLGCEDGPNQIFSPVTPGEVPNNGGAQWTPNDLDENGQSIAPSKAFGAGTGLGGDRVGRARFCDEDEAEAQIREMVAAPIIPDVSVGLIPLLDEQGEPYVVDRLLGRPEDGKFCDPTYVYADAFIWGPTQELVVLFDVETRVVTSVIAFQSYLGTLEGHVTKNGQRISVVAKPRERLRIDGVALDQYAGRDDRNDSASAYLNEANVTLLYGMVRETFFGADPLPAGFNCVQSNLCRIIYTSPTQDSVAQDTFILLEDSGVELRFTPDGHVFFIYGRPVRVAPFEVRTEVDLGSIGFAPRLISRSVPGCVLDLNAELTWSAFQGACLSDERTRSRISFNVHQQRDGVTADFNASSVDFMHRTSMHGVLTDGEQPGDEDVLYGLTWTLSSAAPVKQFIPADLALGYKDALETRLRQSVAPGAAENHPLLNYEVVVPSALLSQDEGVAIDALRTETGESWMQLLRKDVERVYNKLSEEERSLVDSRILNPIYLVEPYIRVVLTQLTNGAVLEDDAFMAFQSTDDHRWSIGFGNFVQEGMAYRLIVQFNLSYDGITAVTVERGYSEIDVLYNGLNRFVRSNSFAPPSPYFELSLSQPEFPANGWGLGKNGIVVNGHDRQLGTLDVTLNAVMPDGTFRQVDLTVPGTHMDDRSGYLRQLRGERYEFVPAHMVKLYGKETVMAFFVEADGTIGRISQLTFKGALTLCEGPRPDMNLSIRYGDDIRRKLKVWQQDVGEDVYRDCELVFNYSPNGNLLDEVVSVRNKIAFWTIAERASTASIWK